jgi:hypothetical protein
MEILKLFCYLVEKLFLMIKQTELRIGNKVMYKNQLVDVLSVHDSGIIYSNQGMYIKVEHISPVQLTGELLISFGFKHSYDGIYKYKYRDLTEVFHTLNEYFFRFDGKFIASCRYLHELQNIFFAIYKEEIRVARSAVLA